MDGTWGRSAFSYQSLFFTALPAVLARQVGSHTQRCVSQNQASLPSARATVVCSVACKAPATGSCFSLAGGAQMDHQARAGLGLPAWKETGKPAGQLGLLGAGTAAESLLCTMFGLAFFCWMDDLPSHFLTAAPLRLLIQIFCFFHSSYPRGPAAACGMSFEYLRRSSSCLPSCPLESAMHAHQWRCC